MTYKQTKFIKSLLWNLGGMLVAFSLDATGKSLGLFNLNPEIVAFAGIIISRLTKVANVYFQEKSSENEM